MKYLIYVCILGLFSSCSDSLELNEINGSIFGTYYKVKIYSEESIDAAHLKTEIDQYLNHLNLIFSTYDKNSELSKLNNFKSMEEIGVSGELAHVLKISQAVSEETEGHFDVTVGPIVNAWGFGPKGVQKKPAEKEIKMLAKHVGMGKFQISTDGDFKKIDENIYIDLSAIAKGYAVDKLLEFLKNKSFENLLVEIGGEVRAIGRKADNSKFRVGIEKPQLVQNGSIIKVVELDNLSLATSGSYRNFRKYGDQVFSHTINPITKAPANNKIISASVLHEKCVYADAYATAMMAMGADKALKFANSLDLMAYILVKNDEKIDILLSEKFPRKGQLK